jgi:hypothetical protein
MSRSTHRVDRDMGKRVADAAMMFVASFAFSWKCGAAAMQAASVLVRVSPMMSIAWLASRPVLFCGQMS